MKRAIALIIAFILCVSLCGTAFAKEDYSLINDETFLLEAARDVIEAYDDFYVIKDISVSDVHNNILDNGFTEITYFVDFVAILDFDNATELPQIQGLLGAVGIDSEKYTTEELTAYINTDELKNMCGMYIENESANILSMSSMSVNTADFVEIKSEVVDFTIDEISEFVNEIETEYIGKTSTFSVGLKVTIDNNFNVSDVSYAMYNGYSHDMSNIIPKSHDAMVRAGEKQFKEILTKAIEKSGKRESDASIDWNSSFVYYRTDARDYANTYTSNATESICKTKSCSNYGGTIRQDTSKYNDDYTWYCCHDCANFVSQAMYAGNVPTSTTWSAGTSAWINCSSMKEYFINKTWWSTSSFENCNAGGIIMLFDKYKNPYHVQMNVMNNTITRAFSSHTNDYKECAYSSTSVFGAYSVSYYTFDNVSPSH